MGAHVLGVLVALFLVLQPAPRTQVAADLAADRRQVADDAPAPLLLLPPQADDGVALPEARTPLVADDDAETRGRRRHGHHRGRDHHGGRHQHRKEAVDGARAVDRQDRHRHQDPAERKKHKKQHRHGGGGGGGGAMQRAEDRHKNPGGGKKNKNNNNNKKSDRKSDKNKTLPLPDDQQIRHRKQRQSRKKGGSGRGRGSRRNNETVAGSSAVNGTAFRRRSEEKQELVGRRTLEVLSPRGSPRAPPPSPALVGILDIPVQESTAAPAAATAAAAAVAVAATSPAPSFKVAVKADGGPGPGRRRPGGGGAAERQPIDAEWLQRLLAAAAVASAKAPAVAADESPCDRWTACSAKLLPAIRTQLAALPACPCTFPANVFYYNKIWDHKHARYFRWRDASGRAERLDVYHPDASHCIRSLHTAATGPGMLAAQHCCYDRNRQLLTRGSGAGTPSLVSPDVSAALHDILDVRPWRVCKGDFTRYNTFRPPNNDNQCAANPDDGEFQRQTELSQFY